MRYTNYNPSEIHADRLYAVCFKIKYQYQGIPTNTRNTIVLLLTHNKIHFDETSLIAKIQEIIAQW